MADKKKSGVQKLYTRWVSPDRAARMEAESRSWFVRCPYCGFERSVWDSGGVRYKAAGNSRWLRRCPKCGQLSWNIVYKREGSQAAGPIALLPAPGRHRQLMWALGLGLLAAVIIAFVVGLILLVSAATQPVVTAGDAFMTALKSGNYTQAYALCAPDLRTELGSASGLANLAQGRRPAQWTWTSRSIRNGVGLLDATFVSTDGKTGSVHLILHQVDNEWRIAGITMNAA